MKRVSFQDIVADYFRNQASWRSIKAEEYPDDERNLRAAAGLEALADHILHLDPTDERLARLDSLTRTSEAEVDFLSLPEAASQMSSRFRFDDLHEGFDDYLARLVEEVENGVWLNPEISGGL